jgi:hypothetical protein
MVTPPEYASLPALHLPLVGYEMGGTTACIMELHEEK